MNIDKGACGQLAVREQSNQGANQACVDSLHAWAVAEVSMLDAMCAQGGDVLT